MVLERINKPNDIKELSDDELKILTSEIREFLINKISVTGGHLASNLGVVELTIALHRVLNFPEDNNQNHSSSFCNSVSSVFPSGIFKPICSYPFFSNTLPLGVRAIKPS